MKECLISVIIPVYNREKTIERAIRSVLDQTWRNLELIVVDDCSSDASAAVSAGIADDRLRVIKLEKNSGACAARNRGIDEAKGEILAFQDSDDCWLPDKLERQMACLDSCGADIVFGQMRRHFPDKEDIFPELTPGVVPYETLIRRPVAGTPTILARRAVFDEERFDPQMRRKQDFDWIIRAAKTHVTAFSEGPVIDTYIQEDSITLLGAEKQLQNHQMLLEKHRDICREYPVFEVMLLKRIVMNKKALGLNPAREYRRIAALEKSGRACAKAVLASLRLMGVVDRFRRR